MVKPHKYKAVPMLYDPIRDIATPYVKGKEEYRNCKAKTDTRLYFASTHEYKVYRMLIGVFGVENVLPQYKLPLVPKCQAYPNGKKWAVDFAVYKTQDAKTPMLLVEAKGYILDYFPFQIALLEAYHPEFFENFYVLFEKLRPDVTNFARRYLGSPLQERIFTLDQADVYFNRTFRSK